MTGSAFRYRLIEGIGQGSTGEVFLGEASSEHLREAWPVALKVMAGPYREEYLQHEAQRLRDLRFPRALGPIEVVQLEDFPSCWTIVMDHAPGADLLQILQALEQRNESLPVRAMVQLGAALFDVLATAHEAPGYPLLHRSLTPSDLRLSPRGELTVVDFAVHRQPSPSALPFCAPEQRLAEPRPASTQSDVYAASAIFLWSLTGEAPSWPQAEPWAPDPGLEDRLSRVASLLGRSPDAHQALTLLASALSSMPEARPAARQLAEALQQLARGLAGVELSLFAARLVPLAQLGEPEPTRPSSRPGQWLPAGVPELIFAATLTFVPLLLALLAVMMVFTALNLRELLSPVAAPPPDLPAPADTPAGFREDPFLHPPQRSHHETDATNQR